MSYNLLNVDPLLLSASIDNAGAHDMAYEGVDLTAYSDEVLDELDEGHQVQVKVADFVHSGQTRNVYVFEADAAGGLSGPWSRVSGAAVSAVTTYNAAPKDLDMVVMSVVSGSSPPSPANKAAAQQNGAGLIKVKIRRRGQLPTLSTRG